MGGKFNSIFTSLLRRPVSRSTYNRRGPLRPSIPIAVPLRKGPVEPTVVPESRGLNWLLESFGIDDVKTLPEPVRPSANLLETQYQS